MSSDFSLKEWQRISPGQLRLPGPRILVRPIEGEDHIVMLWKDVSKPLVHIDNGGQID
jgi:hypothetical protein